MTVVNFNAIIFEWNGLVRNVCLKNRIFVPWAEDF